MKDFYTSQELLDYSSAIALIEKYEFYNKYVKPLENEYEELYIEYENVFDELQELKEKEKRQRQIITRMKNHKANANKSVLDENEVYYCELNNFYIQDLFYEQINILLESIREKSNVVLFKVEKEVKDEK